MWGLNNSEIKSQLDAPKGKYSLKSDSIIC